MQEARLEALQVEGRTLEAESRRLETETQETRAALMITESANSQGLAACDRYLRHLDREKKRQTPKLADWRSRAAVQQKATVEARRQVRLLERLKERRLREWKTAASSEDENLSAELYLARWKK